MKNYIPPLKVREQDGSPIKRPIFELVFNNGTVSISGNTATIDTSSGSGTNLDYSKDTINNSTGSNLINGRAVKITGNDLVAYADNTSDANAEVAGLMFETLATGNSGDIVTHGVIPTGHVSGFSSGDNIYLSSSNGTLTNIPPSSGIVVFIGKYNNGKVYLNIKHIVTLS